MARWKRGGGRGRNKTVATSVAAAAGENVKRKGEAAAAPVGRSLQKGEGRFLFFFCDKEATYTATIKEV